VEELGRALVEIGLSKLIPAFEESEVTGSNFLSARKQRS
jgi:hypothetical protein